MEKLVTTAAVRARMSRQKRHDTSVEVSLRRALHAAGLRYRIHRRAGEGCSP
ncbi:hypothetical protein ABZ766_22980 [Streptomyces sp. NPDC006670]|uniref:hypothetical protein n=1 Tax=Streptomyces sp. NPDC006670 TaxID=3154476 RepID=UPI0034020A24